MAIYAKVLIDNSNSHIKAWFYLVTKDLATIREQLANEADSGKRLITSYNSDRIDLKSLTEITGDEARSICSDYFDSATKAIDNGKANIFLLGTTRVK